MEIITYVQTGAISHKDSLGNVGRIKAGDVQVMSAGSGIVHAEYNKENEPTQLFQIWIMPNQRDQPPSWGTQTFPTKQYVQQLIVLASGYETDSQALPIRAQARVLGGRIKAGKKISYEFTHRQRYGYLVSAKGQINVNGIRLQPRDGAAIHEEESIQIEAITDADIVLVDAPTLSG